MEREKTHREFRNTANFGIRYCEFEYNRGRHVMLNPVDDGEIAYCKCTQTLGGDSAG